MPAPIAECNGIIKNGIKGAYVHEVRCDREGISNNHTHANDDERSIEPVEAWGEDPN